MLAVTLLILNYQIKTICTMFHIDEYIKMRF